MRSYTLGQCFDEITTAYPDNIAIIFPQQAFVSYTELDILANRMAHYMIFCGIKPGEVVCISGEKDIISYAAMLAILKIGALYCILDTEHAPEQLYQTISSCSPEMILASEKMLQDLHTFDLDTGIRTIPRDSAGLEAALDDQPTGSPEVNYTVTDASPACIIPMTSTKGNPRNAVVTHAGIINLIEWSKSDLKTGPGELLAHLNPLSQANSVFDFFTALFTGASLVSFTRPQISKPERLLELIEQTRCTQWFSTPSMFLQLEQAGALHPDSFQSLKRIVLCGERYPLSNLKPLFNRYKAHLDFYNLYGHAACTCICASHKLSDSDFESGEAFPPIGTLMPNFEYVILDDDLQPAAPDSVGQLCLSGPGVGAGYYNEPLQKSGHFINLPLSPSDGQLFYKTGDLVCTSPEKDKLYLRDRMEKKVWRFQLHA